MNDDELWIALESLYAYDQGATDSGVHDEVLRQRCIDELKRRDRDENAFRLWFARAMRKAWLEEPALAQGYGVADLKSFIVWLGDFMEFDI